ncbi:MAG: Maf family protein [Oscillospiraceae bacterium]|jgi:septum formation protein|nr:Maf family protein [Oscillospiraceae bacterium]
MFYKKIILASTSPRRKELLARIAANVETAAPETDESFDTSLRPEEVPVYLSKIKALSVAKKFPENIVIGCDTVVICGGLIFGKPKDLAEARETLSKLSGTRHTVVSGVSVCYNNNICESFSESTEVFFRRLSLEEIADYAATGEPVDKAGAYGIQGRGGALVDYIKGGLCNVIGLPLELLAGKLNEIAKKQKTLSF